MSIIETNSLLDHSYVDSTKETAGDSYFAEDNTPDHVPKKQKPKELIDFAF